MSEPLQSPTKCPKCQQTIIPVKGEIWHFCPLCWWRMDLTTEIRLPRPHSSGQKGTSASDSSQKGEH